MGRRILVADDSSTIQKVIKIAFARHAIEIVEAGSYIEALAAVGRATPDALIIDASLPGVRGPSDFAKLTADAGAAPLLLLVGTYEAVDEGALRAAGFQHFLKKPFESADIVALVERLLGDKLSPAAGLPPPPAPPRAARPAGAPAMTPPPPPLAAFQSPPSPLSSPPAMDGPVVPPLPGSSDRTRHATVIHTGGFATLGQMPPLPQGSNDPRSYSDDDAGPGYGDLGDLAEPAVPPPPPQTDGARKGRRAFSGEVDTQPLPSEGAMSSGRTQRPPEPPPARGNDYGRGGRAGGMGGDHHRDPVPPPPPFQLADRDSDPEESTGSRRGAPGREPAPLTPIPADAGLGGPRTTRSVSTPGVSLHADDDLALGDQANAYRAPPSPPPPSSGSRMATARPSSHVGDSLEELRASLEERLPALVREAVEDYCERHFKSLAKEVIANELRRLADEKARHLVDN
jgi:CheY-like chemotaxis protein